MERRAAGLLLHPTSLPGPFAIGDLGPPAERLLDWMERAGLGVWQLLPVGPTGRHRSPYSATSLFAGNPLLLSPERLVEDGLLHRSSLGRAGTVADDRVDFSGVVRLKSRWLRGSWARFGRRAPAALRREFERFVEDGSVRGWLEDWALFAALRREARGRRWVRWSAAERGRDPAALAAARRRLRDEIGFERYLQFLFFRQWRRLRAEAAARGVRLLGDLPIYPAHDSADVWSNPGLFELAPDGRPLALAGVPPDYFSRTGQLWRQPVYRWDELARRDFRWWVARVGHQLALYDLLRLDHFRGFVAWWRVPAGARTAVGGRWVPGPGRRLFDALRRGMGELPLLAEDLGVITPEVDALRRELGLPGMKVLQFAFDEPDSEHLPEHHGEDCVVYTGTHDNDTTRGWFGSSPPARRRRVLDRLGCKPAEVVRRMIETAYGSKARLAVVPAQDLLGLGSGSRMNVPGRSRGNWAWRAPARLLQDDLAARLRRLGEAAGRL